MAGELQLGFAALVLAGRNRRNRQFKLAIRQRKSATETAVGAELDRTTGYGHGRVRFSSAVKHQVGIKSEPEASPNGWFAAAGAGKGCLRLGIGKSGFVQGQTLLVRRSARPMPPDEVDDISGTHAFG
jgi:hypothetical protein